jgi:molecular chaperone GrpE
VPPGSVVQVMQTGYELQGRLIRPAMVIVTPKAAAVSPATAAAETKAYQPNGADAGGSVDQKA